MCNDARQTAAEANETGDDVSETGADVNETGHIAHEAGHIAHEAGHIAHETGDSASETGRDTDEPADDMNETADGAELPRHTAMPSKQERASAPYNFVPLPDAIAPAGPVPPRDRYDPARSTGMIHCRLVTETPLYTRAALEPEEYGHIEAKDKNAFFYVDPATKRPVIPGSGLRGVFRTMVEIITYSKIQPVTDRQQFFRTADTSPVGLAYRARMTETHDGNTGFRPLAQVGYMERHGHDFKMRPAQTLKGTQHFRVAEDLAQAAIPRLEPMAKELQGGRYVPNLQYRWGRHRVWFKPVQPRIPTESATYDTEVTNVEFRRGGEAAPEAGWHAGWLIATGWAPKKRQHWIVTPPDAEAALVDIGLMDIDAYRENGAGTTQAIMEDHMSVLPRPTGDPIPCFYTAWTDSDGRARIAFGHTAMFRLPCEKSPRDLLPTRLKDSAVLDWAEAIFGRAGDDGGPTIASRVSVTDAHVVGNPHPLYDGPTARAILSAPKPICFQHYLTQSDIDELLSYNDEGRTTLRGHKLYWHKEGAVGRRRYNDAHAPPHSTQHVAFRPVAPGVEFSFDVHYENLTSAELGALLWVLRVCGQGAFRLKVGMGKPLGLGSVRIEKADLAPSDRAARYADLSAEWVTAATLSAPEGHISAFEATLSAPEGHIRAFEAKMLAETLAVLPASENGDTEDFRELRRIKALLTMLHWPGPPRDDTKCMHLKKFKGRPVLAVPQDILHVNVRQEPETVITATVVGWDGDTVLVRVGDEDTRMQPNQLAEDAPVAQLKQIYQEGKVIDVIDRGRTRKGKLHLKEVR